MDACSLCEFPTYSPVPHTSNNCITSYLWSDTPPSLLKILKFPGRKGFINIPQRIGTKYTQFGVFLLKDGTGAQVQAIEKKHCNDAEQINLEILQKWLNGEGKQPVTWETLTAVLCDAQLTTLADEIKCQLYKTLQ